MPVGSFVAETAKKTFAVVDPAFASATAIQRPESES